ERTGTQATAAQFDRSSALVSPAPAASRQAHPPKSAASGSDNGMSFLRLPVPKQTAFSRLILVKLTRGAKAKSFSPKGCEEAGFILARIFHTNSPTGLDSSH